MTTRKIITEVVFYVIATAIMAPAPLALLAWMTNQTWQEVVFR